VRGKFTARAIKALELAQYEAAQFDRNYIETEHILLGLIGEGEGTAARVLKEFDMDIEALRDRVEELTGVGEGCDGNFVYTPRARRIIELAMRFARQIGHNYVGTEHILLGIINEKGSLAYTLLVESGVDVQAMNDRVVELLGEPGGISPDDMIQKGDKKKTKLLNEYGRDLNELAKQDKLDPVIGRDREIERVIQILNRRTKNNPVLIGEPGVGKTAIAEALAERILEGSVPDNLKEKRVVSLNISSVVAGAKYRGEFEERLRKIIDEIRSAGNVILFIDELHTLIGAGGAEGAIDAANILKPALARGELQAIGATTLKEYRKYIEKDSALERRFQTVLIGEPDIKASIAILKGVRDRYEAFHHATITDEAVEAAAKLSHRYITDRFLPDKAIDLMDEAASKARIGASDVPPAIKDLEDAARRLKKDKEAAAEAQEFERAAEIRDKERAINEKLQQEKNKWQDEGAQHIIVTEDDIEQVISSWTGIPLKKLAVSEAERLLKLEKIIEKRVIGQADAVQAVAKAVRRARAGLKEEKRPIGSFLFLGPTGVGKTELARALAESLFGDEAALIRFDMSEYMEKHTVARLIGAPPGYVGYEEGGQLTDAVRRKPYAVILLDEIEKAHYDLFNILLQVLDDGRLTDSQGRTADFKNTVIIMTSNIGAKYLKADNKAIGFMSDEAAEQGDAKKKVLEEAKRLFRPEFMNRIDETIVFNALAKGELVKIIDIMLKDVAKRLSEKHLAFTVSDGAKEILVKEGSDFAYGARPLKRAIQKLVEDEIAERLLAGEYKSDDTIRLTAKGGKLIFGKK
jgi:ATP-dependent Clp protease ATP-binding subunit ClpC